MKDGNVEAVYTGTIRNIGYRGRAIFGQAEFKKREKISSIRVRRRLVRWFPPKIEKVEVPVVRRGDWFWLTSDSRGLAYWHEDDIASDMVIEHGKPCDDYKIGLVNDAANKTGLMLSKKLIDLVFGPIEERLIRHYREIMGFYEHGGKNAR